MTNVFINGIDLTGPDKSVLLLANEDLLPVDLYEIKKQLDERFPNTNFVILSGFSAMVVPKTPSYDFEVDDE
jgi:hypothetical protein